MSNKKQRMFSLDIVDTDKFLELSSGARLLYYDLGIRADQEGFVGSPKSIMRVTKASEEDMRSLVREQYVYPFGSGVVVILDFFVNNALRKDRAIATLYQKEKSLLCYDTLTKKYIPPEDDVMVTNWLPNGNQLEAENKVNNQGNINTTAKEELDDTLAQLLLNGINEKTSKYLLDKYSCQAIKESINYAIHNHPAEVRNMPGFIISCIERNLRLEILLQCPRCNGERYWLDDNCQRMIPCTLCDGKGKVIESVFSDYVRSDV